MFLKLYSVLDRKAGFFKTPYAARSDGEMTRNLADAMRDPATTIAQYPEDFSLYEIGSFDDTTGLMVAVHPPRHVCDATQLMPKPRPADTQPDLLEAAQ